MGARRSGAAACMARAAQARVVVAAPPRHRTIAMLASPTGWQVGPSPRRPGAARTAVRAARLPRAVALEDPSRRLELPSLLVPGAPSSGGDARIQHPRVPGMTRGAFAGAGAPSSSEGLALTDMRGR